MSKKKNDGFLQFPLPVFVKMFPEFAEMLPPLFDFSDSNYVVRVDPANGRVEIGHATDAWLID
jgi:hypothetical protein